MLLKLPLAPGTGEEAPFIFQALGVDDIGALKFGFLENQVLPPLLPIETISESTPDCCSVNLYP